MQKGAGFFQGGRGEHLVQKTIDFFCTLRSIADAWAPLNGVHFRGVEACYKGGTVLVVLGQFFLAHWASTPKSGPTWCSCGDAKISKA